MPLRASLPRRGPFGGRQSWADTRTPAGRRCRCGSPGPEILMREFFLHTRGHAVSRNEVQNFIDLGAGQGIRGHTRPGWRPCALWRRRSFQPENTRKNSRNLWPFLQAAEHRRRVVCGHVAHAPCAPGISPVRAPVNPLRRISRRRKYSFPPRSFLTRQHRLKEGGYPAASLTISCPDFPQRHAVKLIPRLDINHALPLAFTAIQRHARRRSLRVQPHDLPGPAHRARDKHAGRRGLA